MNDSSKQFISDEQREAARGKDSHRWEYGSEFAWVEPLSVPYQEPILPQGTVLFGSGRQALVAVLKSGATNRGWRRCLVPTYICQSVVEAILEAGLECLPYPDCPISTEPPKWEGLRPSDCVLVVNHFGWRLPEISHRVLETPAGLIEDHTHDPWSHWATHSPADYCIISLRKTLPLPDGGAAWSPKRNPLDSPASEDPCHQHAALGKLSAMFLKAEYLAGRAIEKELFRSLQVEGEKRLTAKTISAPIALTPYLLERFPWKRWREMRASNAGYLIHQLAGTKGLEVLNPTVTRDHCPFGVLLRCPDERVRDSLQKHLIERSMYPAVLWPEHPHMSNDSQAVALARRTLFLHADFRYDQDDLDRVVAAIREFFSS